MLCISNMSQPYDLFISLRVFLYVCVWEGVAGGCRVSAECVNKVKVVCVYVCVCNRLTVQLFPTSSLPSGSSLASLSFGALSFNWPL